MAFQRLRAEGGTKPRQVPAGVGIEHRHAFIAATILGIVLAASLVPIAAASEPSELVAVIVRGTPGSLHRAESLVLESGAGSAGASRS